jgi:hypothetical protein
LKFQDKKTIAKTSYISSKLIIRNCTDSVHVSIVRREARRMKGNPMPQLTAAEIYERMGQELFAALPLPIEDLFDDPSVRLRVGKIISEAVSHPPKGAWPVHW